ncbi:MAG: non-canonical purine NTP diphosphatase [Bacteroidota bacterium]
MNLVIASNNTHKIQEIQPILDNSFSLMSLSEIGCADELPEEQETLEGNASQKAWYIYNKFGYNCFADDTGLEIEALGGEPGVYSARYAGDGKDADANIDKVLDKLHKINNRKARFRTVISLVLNGIEYSFEGIVDGKILTERQGTGGFGYDPIFQPDESDRSFAMMSISDKNRISHRARAVIKLAEFLKQHESA